MTSVLNFLKTFRVGCSDVYLNSVEKQSMLSKAMNDYVPVCHPLLLNRELLPAALRPAYSILLEAYQKNVNNVRLPLPDGASRDELGHIHSAVLNDNPALFYIGGFSYTSGKNPVVYPKYVFVESERETYTAKINSKIKDIVSHAPLGSFAREKYVNDYLLSTVRYGVAKDKTRAHSIIGALIDGMAVCEGISKATSVLLNSMNVSCCVVTGKFNDAPHAWNVVEVAGERYHLDVTNNGDVLLKDSYFNLSDRLVSKTHRFESAFGCIDETRAYGGRAYLLSSKEVSAFLRGFMVSGDRLAMIAVTNYSESLFNKDIELAMRLCGSSISCRCAANEKAGLYAVERVR